MSEESKQHPTKKVYRYQRRILKDAQHHLSLQNLKLKWDSLYTYYSG